MTSEHSSRSHSEAPSPGAIFATTHWSVVLAAAGAAATTDSQARAALEELCQTYWFPIYAFIRRRGHPRPDAEDLTQEFFHQFLQRNDLARLESARGLFRAYLLAAVKNFLANQWDRRQARKRGGGVPHLSLDWRTADSLFQLAPCEQIPPDLAFDREWALALLSRVLQTLEEEALREGADKAALFKALRPSLAADTSPPAGSYAQLARSLGLTETALRVAAHRLRKRYRHALRQHIAHTLADPAETEAELQALFAAFR
jgi:RNA polymerase sigma-70 factor (ECF subfamily)